MAPKPTVRFSQRADLKPIADCPSCGQALPHRRRVEAWIEAPVDDQWMAAYRIVVRNHQPLVAEVRLFPLGKKNRRAGAWSEEPRAVPIGGVPGRVLRSLRLRDPLELFPQFIRDWERLHGRAATDQVLRRFRMSGATRLVSRRPGRAGRPDEFYLAWAAAYAERVRAGSRRPIKDLAARPPMRIEGQAGRASGVPEATVRDIVHQARKRGYLTSSPRAQAGGELTDDALRMLRRMKRRKKT